MVVWDHFITGRPATIASTSRRKIGALCRYHGYHHKVGITNNPEVRFLRHAVNGARTMHVLYESSSLDNVRELERVLLAWLPIRTATGVYYNATGGGGGRVPKSGPYYLYVIGAPKYARVAKQPSGSAPVAFAP